MANIVNGTEVLFYVDGTKIAYTTSATLDISMETRDATTKDSSGWAEKKEAIRSWSGSFDSLLVTEASYGIEDLFSLLDSRSSFTVRMVTGAVDRCMSLTGTAFLTSLNLTGPMEDSTSWSGSFEGDGELDMIGLT